MTTRALKLCSLHRVQHVDGCPKCNATRWARQDRRRVSSHARGYDAAWRRVARLALQRDGYLCVCGELATEVDHVKPVDTHPQLRLQLDNLRSLCHSCHVRKTHKDKRHAQA